MTKKRQIKLCQDIRNKYKDKEFLNAEDFKCIDLILRKHRWYKQKVGSGEYDILVGTNKLYNTRGFFILRDNGTTTDFSFYECIYPTKVFKQDFIKAARAAIAEDIIKARTTYFNRSTIHICDICRKSITINNSHADHFPIKFKTLLDNFIKLYNIKDFEKLTEPESWDNKIGCEITDEKVIFSWIYYHMKYAKLRMLCPGCNLSLG